MLYVGSVLINELAAARSGDDLRFRDVRDGGADWVENRLEQPERGVDKDHGRAR